MADTKGAGAAVNNTGNADKNSGGVATESPSPALEHALNLLIDLARVEFGETEYAYYRILHRWTGKGRDAGYCSAVGKGTPITKEEYDANVEAGKTANRNAFFSRGNYGKRRGSARPAAREYYSYDREVSKDGWREKLIERIAVMPDAPLLNALERETETDQATPKE